MKSRLNRPIVHNILSLYGVEVANFIVPLLTVPYLSRVLKPESWGFVLFCQAVLVWFALILEYGFAFSATREVAKVREDKDAVGRIFAGVNAAKLTLSAIAFTAAGMCWLWVPELRSSPRYLMWTVLAAICQGFSPLWCFMGLEKVRIASAINIGAKILATVSVFIFVHGPNQAWIVLASQAIAAVVAAVVSTAILFRLIPPMMPTWHQAKSSLKDGWSMFVFTAASSLYGAANVFMLGVISTKQQVAYFGGVDTIRKAGIRMLVPLGQALYPRMVHEVHHNRPEADRLARKSLALTFGVSLICGVIIAAFAPICVHILLGDQYKAAIPVLQVLAIQLPLTGLSRVVGVQWMLPLGMDRIFNVIVLTAGALNLGIVFALVPRLGAIGTAWALVVTEVFVVVAMIAAVQKSGQAFWSQHA